MATAQECSHCGADVDAYDQKCPACGNRLGGAALERTSKSAVAIKCAGCGHAITVEYDTRGVPREERTVAPWSCPHGCGCAVKPTLLGRIIGVWVGHEPKPPGPRT